MGRRRNADEDQTAAQEALRQLKLGDDPAILEYVSRLRSKYGKYALPIEEARSIIDKAMDGRSLTDVLYEMRQSEP